MVSTLTSEWVVNGVGVGVVCTNTNDGFVELCRFDTPELAEHIVELHNGAIALLGTIGSDKHPFEMKLKEMVLSALNTGAGQVKFTMKGKDESLKVLALVAIDEEAKAINAYADQLEALSAAGADDLPTEPNQPHHGIDDPGLQRTLADADDLPTESNQPHHSIDDPGLQRTLADVVAEVIEQNGAYASIEVKAQADHPVTVLVGVGPGAKLLTQASQQISEFLASQGFPQISGEAYAEVGYENPSQES